MALFSSLTSLFTTFIRDCKAIKKKFALMSVLLGPTLAFAVVQGTDGSNTFSVLGPPLG